MKPGEVADGAGSRRRQTGPLGVKAKVRLILGVLKAYVAVRFALLRGTPLPTLVDRLHSREAGGTGLPALDPRRVGRIVTRILRLGPFRARCLTSSLVLLRLLREQGTSCDLLIGLPGEGETVYGHAWVEVGGVEVGPPPGRMGHRVLVRYDGGARSPTKRPSVGRPSGAAPGLRTGRETRGSPRGP